MAERTPLVSNAEEYSREAVRALGPDGAIFDRGVESRMEPARLEERLLAEAGSASRAAWAAEASTAGGGRFSRIVSVLTERAGV